MNQSQNYEEVIVQNVAGFVSKTTSNISFKMNLKLPKRNMFAHLATGKVCIRIYDFRDGKGENATEVTARIDIETLPYLYECARTFQLRQTFFESKIFGEPMRSGSYHGLCQMTRLQISRQETLANGNQNGSPWGIAISNGYAKKIQSKSGGYMAEKNSYRETRKAFFSMTDRDFLYCIKNCMDYISIFKQYAADCGYLAENLDKMNERREQYQSQVKEQEATVESSEKQEKPSNNTPNDISNIRSMDIQLVSKMEKNTDGKFWCYASFNGKRFILEFPGLLPRVPLNHTFTADIKVGKEKCFFIGSK